MHYLEYDRMSAFKRLYETNVSALMRFARTFAPMDVAEDIIQEVFLELWKNRKVLDEKTAHSYLFTAVRNRCINHIKQEQKKNKDEDKALLEIRQRGLHYYDSIEKIIVEKEDLQQIYETIEQLPDKCKQIFKLSYFEDKKSIEIAKLLNLSIRTVEHQLYLGLKTLRSLLNPKN